MFGKKDNQQKAAKPKKEKKQKKAKAPKAPKEKKQIALFSKKEKEPQQPQYLRSVTNMQTLNYNVYYMSAREKIMYAVLAFIAGGVVGYAFFGGLFKNQYGDPTMLTHIVNIVEFVVFGSITAYLFIPMRTKQLKDNRQRMLRLQFRDMLEALNTSLNAGRNINDSFISAAEDLGNQYEAGAYILNELDVINGGVRNGATMEELLVDFGERSGIDDIKDFANVFEICFQKGGNIKDTVRNTYDIINDKTAVSEDIQTMVAGTQMELNMMLALPVLMVVMMKAMSSDFAANFATISGFTSELIAIVIFVAAYFIGKKILDIRL